jgi:hypothetical protein
MPTRDYLDDEVQRLQAELERLRERVEESPADGDGKLQIKPRSE